MDEQETIVDVAAGHRAFRGFSLWLAVITGTVTLGVVSCGVWLERAYLPLVGVIAIAGVVVLIRGHNIFPCSFPR